MAYGGMAADINGELVLALAPNSLSGKVQQLTIGATVQTSNTFTPMQPRISNADRGLVNPAPVGTTHVRLCADTACWIMIGPNPLDHTHSAATGMYFPPNSPEYFPVRFGDCVYVVQYGTGTGTLNITECR
jgi:hypothetical protein